jgi:SAM-dependent methyltransferase
MMPVQDTTAQQTWSAETYARNARFVSDLGADALAWLDPRPAERILDLGCGDGALTVRIAEAGAHVVGVDASEAFVTAARARGLDVRHGDGEALDFEADFDAVFSNAALHWMRDADAVITGVRRALKPHGRFVGEFGGHGNVAAIVTAMRAVAARHGIDESLVAPWYFPTAAEYTERLEAGGFRVDRTALIPRPTPLPSGLSGWLRTFRVPFFHAAGQEADRIAAEIEALLAPALRDGAGTWTADYVRLRFEAHAV